MKKTTTTTTAQTMQTLKLVATTREINGANCIELAITARNNEGNTFTYYRHHAFLSNDKQEQGEIMYVLARQAIIIDENPENTWNGYNIHKLITQLMDNGYISEKLGQSLNLS